VGYNAVTDNMGLSSFVQPLLPSKSSQSNEIPRKFGRIAVQGHSRSLILLPVESTCTTSY